MHRAVRAFGKGTAGYEKAAFVNIAPLLYEWHALNAFIAMIPATSTAASCTEKFSKSNSSLSMHQLVHDRSVAHIPNLQT